MLLLLNTVFWCVPLYLLALVRLVLPLKAVRVRIDPWLNEIATRWIAGNSGWMRLTQRTRWDVQGVDGLPYHGWYLVNCNHLGPVVESVSKASDKQRLGHWLELMALTAHDTDSHWTEVLLNRQGSKTDKGCQKRDLEIQIDDTDRRSELAIDELTTEVDVYCHG
mgnify:CR=1 FL=1